MKIDETIIKYLNGELFSTALKVEIDKSKHDIISRELAIVNVISNKSVIHVGCSDHIQKIEEKINNNTWLHKLITDNAKSCLGIDIDKVSIDFITNNLGYRNVIYGDIVADDIKEINTQTWDYVIFGEIVEHLDNPVDFLKSFKVKYGDNVKNFIITVPNIYNLKQYKNMLRYCEVINSDHRFWFTPYTILKLVSAAGYNPEQVTYSNLQSLTTIELIKRKIARSFGYKLRYPFYYFKTLIITGKIN